MGLWEILKGEQPGIIRSILHFEDVGQFGEYSTEFALTNDNLEGELVVLKNVYVPYKGRTTEIDLLMLHEKGLFVFESKNYSGWIFGDANQLNWTQSLQNGEKHRFYNPIRQNQTHIKALSEYLGLPLTAFTSYIVFSERCNLKRVPEDTERVIIVRRPNMLKKLRAQLGAAVPEYSREEFCQLAEKLRSLTNKSEAEKRQHVDEIREICPFCGSRLVLRQGKYGQFWGCSTYPRCRFTRPL